MQGATPNAAPPRVSTGEDVARSFGSRFVRGTGGVVGMPTDLGEVASDALSGGFDWVVRQGMRAVGMSDEQIDRAQANVDAIRNNRGVFGATVRRSPEGDIEARPAGGGGFGDGRWWPSGEQVASAIDALIPGDPYDPQTTAGEFAGRVGEYLPGALTMTPGSIGARVTVGVAGGVGDEALGQATEGSDIEPLARFVGGMAGGAAGANARNLATRGGRTPDQRAVRLIDREMRDQGTAPDELVRRANRMLTQAPTVETNAELIGPGGYRMARAVSAMGRGAGRARGEEVLSARAEGRNPVRASATQPGRPRVTSIRDRLMRETARMTGAGDEGYFEALDELRRIRFQESANAYREAYRAALDPDLVNTQLLPYMRTAPRDAFRSAVNQLDSEALRLRARLSAATMSGDESQISAITQEIDDVIQARNQMAAFAQGQSPNTVNARAIDYFQRGLRQLEVGAGRGSPEAGSLREARAAFNGMADRINPLFERARTRYSQSNDVENMMEAGRKVFSTSEGEIDRLMRGRAGFGMSADEFDGFMVGVMDAIETKINAGETGFLARLTRNRNWQNQLAAAVGGEKNARRFMTRLAREAGMQNFRNFVQSGSRTAPLQQDIVALTVGEAEMAFLNDQVRSFVASGGNLRAQALRLMTDAYNRIYRPGIADPAVQEALSRRLFETVTREGAQQLRDELLALRRSQSTPQYLRRWIERYGGPALAASGSARDENAARADAERPRRLGETEDQRWAREQLESMGVAP